MTPSSTSISPQKKDAAATGAAASGNAGGGLPKSYTPSESEGAIRAKWDAAKAFHANPNTAGDPFCILIPPPNVTAALHLGHAFNNTLQDVLVRYHRMKGDKTLWMPGTDHAGIATQTVVEKRLLLQGKKRTDFTRDEFIAKVQEWKDEYEATIIEQLKAMGCSCDFDRTRFTMDEVCAKAVREAFFRLFKDGLIYRGKRLVNWDPVTQTALADDEVEMEEVQGHMWYLRYPLVAESGSRKAEGLPGKAEGLPSLGFADGEFVTVATTRPETMLGDTAVAINPKDPRAAQYVGHKVRLPIVNREIPIIADDYVVRPPQYGGDPSDPKAAFATGFLKVTPAHDPNDEQIWMRHNDEIPHGQINIFAPDATISDKHGWTDISDEARPLVGLTREEARKKIVQWFKDHGLLEDVKPYTHSVGHSYRSHVPIEPYLSDQWYVKVTDDRMRGEALRAMAREQLDGGTGVSPVHAPVKQELLKQRRNLPHWQMGGSTYFVTFHVQSGSLNHDERDIVLNACKYWDGRRMTLHIVTVMPDHVHLIFAPLPSTPGQWYSISDLLHSIKSFTAHEIQKFRNVSGKLWQDESFDRIIRDEEEFLEKWNYIWTNSVKAGIAAAPEEYPFTFYATSEPGTGETPVPPDEGDHELRFYPARYAKTFQQWHENLRDWCISRQLWWGHRIPVWEGVPKSILHATGNAFKKAMDEFLQKINEWEDANRVKLIFSTWVQGLSEADKQNYPWRIGVRDPIGDDRTIVSFLESEGLIQDPDVLDTWFSSALWPLSTMGWPDPDAFPNEIPEGSSLLNTFNPSSVLCTAREIITLWVSRMVMFNRYFRDGKLPFKDVYIHAMIQDGHGQKMSKSLGNGVDPRDIIHTHGADAMRFVLTQIATATQDVRLPVDTMCPHPGCGETFHPKEITTSAGHRVAAPEQTCPKCGKKMISGYGAASGLAQPTKEIPLARNTSSKFDQGRNFANKLWNATRFALSNLTSSKADGLPKKAEGLPSLGFTELALVDRWIIARLHRTLHAVEDAINEYQFNAYADAMYDLVWRDFCDWYLEAIKPTVKSNPSQQQVLRTVLNAILRLLHPMMPFVTEALWPHVAGCGSAGLPGITLEPSDLLATAGWPDIKCSVEDADAVAIFERIQKLIEAIRSLKTERNVQKKKATLHAPAQVIALIHGAGGAVESLTGLESVQPIPQNRPAGVIPLAFEGQELLLAGLVDQVDVAAENTRLTKLIAEKERAITGFRSKLENAGYVSKAPPEKVDETRRLLAQAEADLDAARKALQSLG